MMGARVSRPAPVVSLLPQLADYAARQYGDAAFVLRHTPDGWSGYSRDDGWCRVQRA